MREMKLPAGESEPFGVSMEQFCHERPGLRYVFFGGRGGVGKTAMAGAMALGMAGGGRRVLLASANPAHGLSGLLGQDVFGRHTSVAGVENLWAYEMDFEGSTMLESMGGLMLASEYEAYVFDTVPAESLRRLLSSTTGEPRGRIAQVEKLLRDPAQTAFFFVTLPEALPIAAIRRFIAWFTDFGIPIGGVVVNGVIEGGSGGEAPELVRNRIAIEQGYLEEIQERFDGLIRAVVPLYGTEIRGVPMLERAAAALFA